MGNINDKLNYLNETKEAIKTSLQDKGIAVEDSDTFRSYAEKINNYNGIDTSDATATAENIEKGKTAYVNGELITGTITKYGGTNNVATSVTNDISNSAIRMSTQTTEKRMYSDGATIQLYTEYAKVSEAIGLQSEQIVSGETVLGVEGTFAGGEYNAKIVNPGTSGNVGIRNWITEVDFTNLDFSNISNMNSFFSYTRISQIDLINTSNVTDMGNIFAKCVNLTTIPQLDTSSVTMMNSAFEECENLTTIPQLDISKVTNLNSVFYGCSALTTIPQLDTSSANSIKNMFYGCEKIEYLGGLKYLGKAYTQKSNNYSNYKLDLTYCTTLTHDSLMNVINNLYDLNLTYDVANGGTLYTQQLVLGATNLAKLTEEEIAIATNKGWTVS